jgi:hypothetical protein
VVRVRKSVIAVIFSIVALTRISSASAASCQPTLPNGRGIPTEEPAPYLHGNDALSTGLDIHGTTYTFDPRRAGPGVILPDGSLRWPKIGFRRGVRGRLTIDGRRLDAPAPPLRPVIPDGYGDIGFQVAALVFPTPGCWEITGRVGNASLSFVVNVVRLDASGPAR